MSTEAPRRSAAASRRRRSRRFLTTFTAVLGALVLIGAAGAAVGVAQGPRVTRVQVDEDAAVSASGSRVIFTTTESLREVAPEQVSVEPAAGFTVDTAGRNVGVRFTLPLYDETEYTVTVRDVEGLGSGPPATLRHTFRTGALQEYLLQRGSDGTDSVFRTDLSGENAVPVFQHSHIEDFRATAEHLVISVREDDQAALIVTDRDGGNARELPLPGDGFVSNLQTADRGEIIGYTFSDADVGSGGGRDSVLYTTALTDGAVQEPPTEVQLAGDDTRVAEWRFVPDTDSILVLTFDGSLLLSGAEGADSAALGSAVSIYGIARGSAQAIVERLDGLVVLDLTDGTEQPLVAQEGATGVAGAVTPVPGEDAGTIRTYAVLGDGGALASTTVVHVSADGESATLLDAGVQDAVLQTCVSPSGRYVAVLLAPDAAANAYDRYLLPLPERVETRILEIATARQVVSLHGFGFSWCRVPPS